jgi:hypothetical protein
MGGSRGKGGEMTQSLYAHMNIIKKEKKKIQRQGKKKKKKLMER